jgi:hypothetical protein
MLMENVGCAIYRRLGIHPFDLAAERYDRSIYRKFVSGAESIAVFDLARKTRSKVMSGAEQVIASQLNEFVKAVERKTKSPRRDPPKRYMAAEPPKDRVLVIYEECLKQLPPEDIAKLGRILERMAEELKKVKG